MAISRRYCIQIEGHLPTAWSKILEGMQVTCLQDGVTVLEGPLRDQAELYGLITKLENLGLTLISVNSEPDGP